MEESQLPGFPIAYYETTCNMTFRNCSLFNVQIFRDKQSKIVTKMILDYHTNKFKSAALDCQGANIHFHGIPYAQEHVSTKCFKVELTRGKHIIAIFMKIIYYTYVHTHAHAYAYVHSYAFSFKGNKYLFKIEYLEFFRNPLDSTAYSKVS